MFNVAIVINDKIKPEKKSIIYIDSLKRSENEF